MQRFFLPLFLVSCTTTLTPATNNTPILATSVNAEIAPQLAFSVDGVKYIGTASLPRKSASNISLSLPPTTAFVIVSTCAREDRFWQPDTTKPFIYNFYPAIDAEDVGACPLSLIAVTKEGEWHRALIDYANPTKVPLPASIMCNGRWGQFKTGSSLCAVDEGKFVKVSIPVNAAIGRDTTTTCAEPKIAPIRDGMTTDGKDWEIPVKAGFCVYVILNDTQKFRLTIYGYNTFLKPSFSPPVTNKVKKNSNNDNIFLEGF